VVPYKRMVKRTYNLPPELISQWESQVEPGKRSALLAELIHEWLERRRRAAIRKDVIEGCRAMADISLELERDFHRLEEESER